MIYIYLVKIEEHRDITIIIIIINLLFGRKVFHVT